MSKINTAKRRRARVGRPATGLGTGKRLTSRAEFLQMWRGAKTLGEMARRLGYKSEKSVASIAAKIRAGGTKLKRLSS